MIIAVWTSQPFTVCVCLSMFLSQNGKQSVENHPILTGYSQCGSLVVFSQVELQINNLPKQVHGITFIPPFFLTDP